MGIAMAGSSVHRTFPLAMSAIKFNITLEAVGFSMVDQSICSKYLLPVRRPIITFPDKRINVDSSNDGKLLQPAIFTGQEKLNLTLTLSSLGAIVKA